MQWSHLHLANLFELDLIKKELSPYYLYKAVTQVHKKYVANIFDISHGQKSKTNTDFASGDQEDRFRNFVKIPKAFY